LKLCCDWRRHKEPVNRNDVEIKKIMVRFEVLPAVTISSSAFWDVPPCSLVYIYICCGRTSYISTPVSILHSEDGGCDFSLMSEKIQDVISQKTKGFIGLSWQLYKMLIPLSGKSYCLNCKASSSLHVCWLQLNHNPGDMCVSCA
jgi:hypothetical protein